MIGEIYIGGTHVAHGYHRRPALTAERFVADPFNPGARLYRSGDLAAATQTGISSSSGAPMSRSRSAASASSSVRSLPRSRSTPASGRPSWSPRICRSWARAWSATSPLPTVPARTASTSSASAPGWPPRCRIT
ncbi:AMP-binding enzyme family protein [Mycobacterium xenopi 4042]|uniref:AMP-binding enzyme family protein n=1 Tax=Mycobacterium xenopi 4042 TaxID=1299334 RepID=X8AQQ4_MYCXE|nr:AMP-binding enzyme family protein [Mycobacterium xenopi 4042]